MSFKKWEEPSIDIETGEAPPKPTKVKSTAPEIFAVFFEVLGYSPNNWRINKTQRAAAENLHAEHGLDAVRNALKFYQAHKDVEYCPVVSSPYDLDSKWKKLTAFKKKQ